VPETYDARRGGDNELLIVFSARRAGRIALNLVVLINNTKPEDSERAALTAVVTEVVQTIRHEKHSSPAAAIRKMLKRIIPEPDTFAGSGRQWLPEGHTDEKSPEPEEPPQATPVRSGYKKIEE
jgi:hypothetical protein